MYAYRIKRLFRNMVIIAINKGFVKHTIPPQDRVILKSKFTEDGMGWYLKVPGKYVSLEIIEGEMYISVVNKQNGYVTKEPLEKYIARMDSNICPWSYDVILTDLKKMKTLVKVISKQHKTKTLSKHQEMELNYA